MTCRPTPRSVSKVITHKPVFMLATIPALVWPNIRVEIEATAVRRPAT